jgi:hypothetical protein
MFVIWRMGLRLTFRRTHNVSFNLELPTHEKFLRVRIARNQFSKVLVAQQQCGASLLALRRCTLADSAGFFQIDIPRFLIAGFVLECESEDGFAVFDGVFAVGVGSGKGARDLVEGGGGGEVVYFPISYVPLECRGACMRVPFLRDMVAIWC